jgi:hypothetical protein
VIEGIFSLVDIGSNPNFNVSMVTRLCELAYLFNSYDDSLAFGVAIKTLGVKLELQL